LIKRIKSSIINVSIGGLFFMPRKITDSCIACGTCFDNCPVSCITEGDIYKIDPDQCIDCGLCQENCPVQAIEEE